MSTRVGIQFKGYRVDLKRNVICNENELCMRQKIAQTRVNRFLLQNTNYSVIAIPRPKGDKIAEGDYGVGKLNVIRSALSTSDSGSKCEVSCRMTATIGLNNEVPRYPVPKLPFSIEDCT